MAQTKKRRRTKHRGNAAGMVEARGRTGRRPEENEKRGGMREDAATRRRNRMETPPTWKSAFNRSLFATAIFAIAAVVILDRTIPQAVTISVLLLALYVPATYYIDGYMHRRYMRKQAR
ncbi:MAG TPA: hypothetical protein VF529_13610 [Solirubrobacteraceae bacterium]|jgi:hypothetical protein